MTPRCGIKKGLMQPGARGALDTAVRHVINIRRRIKLDLICREAAQATALVTGGLAHSSTVMYSFQQPTRLKLVLVDVDDVESSAHVDPATCDQLGSLEFDLVEVVTQPNRQLSRALSKAYHPEVDSQVLLLAEELLEARQVLTLHLAAALQGLEGEEAERRPDPFLLISKYLAAEGGGWVPVFRTEVQHSSVHPSWHSFSLKATQLNSGDRSRPLKMQVFDWQVDDNHRLLAQTETTTHQLLQLSAGTAPNLPLPLTLKAVAMLGACSHTTPGRCAAAAGVQGSLELLGPQSQAPAGQLTVLGLKVSEEPSFLDFIRAGVELSFLVGIDFTASNGPHTSPDSLHYLSPHPGASTPYEDCLMAIANVLKAYDTDHDFPAFGFGGRKAPHVTNHCFHLNGQADPVCLGIDAVCQAYRHALEVYELSGPTLFAPVIRMACNLAQQPHQTFNYLILLILTDGAIQDIEDTTDALVVASYLPMSVLIVGIGDADFQSMAFLDADDKVLRSTLGRPSERDVVQASGAVSAGSQPHVLGLPCIGKAIAEQRKFVFDPAKQIGVGIDPGVTEAVRATSGVWDMDSGQLVVDQLARWKLTKARRNTQRWLPPIEPLFQHLAAARSKAAVQHIMPLTWDRFASLCTGRSPPARAWVSAHLEETKLAAQQAARAAVSIKDVIDAGLVKPGPSIVSLAHKDTTYFASLLPSGDIDYEGKTFDSAPAFALHVKRILAPKLSAAEGYRSVHLSGVSLEDLRHRIVLMREAGDNKLTTPVVPATPLAPEELPVLPSTVDVQLPATEDGTAEGEDEPDTANWVQCSRCQAWRVVPDEFWPDIDAIGDEDWFCNEATWDVTAYEPYTEPCK
ncbi:hypothetical protein QJQ45_009536 [Haematococcus lacustris]|nr:hypothetical protein QJQ45_009536 [Haematococcus lacustris]